VRATLSCRYLIIKSHLQKQQSLRIGIASHVVLDTIRQMDGSSIDSLGGPPCYCGLTSRRFGFDVALATRIGSDFPSQMVDFLLRNKIAINENHRDHQNPTTRFSICSQQDTRTLSLASKCGALTPEDIGKMKVDCWLASPVVDEISTEVLAAIKADGGARHFCMLDPQGYMRSVDSNGIVTLKDRLDLDLSGVRAIKVDEEEMRALTGGIDGLEGMKVLQSRGIEFVVSTIHREIHLLHEKTHYWAKMKEMDAPDSTGAGDILCAAFCCSFVKEKDPLWAICFGAGAVKAALESGQSGLDKVPSMGTIEENASYFYNTIGFKQLS
jgi:sugar/nucleoside kinase (ribokinase family)